MAQGGESVGHYKGRVVFVRGGLPGETVSARLTQTRERYARGIVSQVLSAAPERVDPRCPVFGRCGGCHWQYAAYPAQIAFKQTILEEQCQRLGGIEEPPIGPALAMSNPWAYRSKAQFRLSAEGNPGFYARQSHDVVPILQCPLLVPKLNVIVPLLERAKDIPPAHRPSEISLRYSWAEEECHVQFHGGTRRGATTLQSHLVGEVSEISWRKDRETRILEGRGFLLETLGGMSLRVSADSFFQVNVPQTRRLLQTLIDLLEPQPDDHLLDAYSGVGALSLPIAPHVKTVTAIEAHAAAVADFRRNTHHLGATNVRVLQGLVERVLPELARGFDVIILDPPRRGCLGRALEAVVQCRPRRIGYVSCHPGTLARDLRLLCAQEYRLLQIVPVDLFPQTFHVESVSLLERAT
jgi:23S rRNA (uracil1939-C5)-methyltransferase